MLILFFAFTFSISSLAKSIFDTAPEANLEIYADKAIPGRCFYAHHTNQKTAATLMVHREYNEYFVAPLSGEGYNINYFDNKSFAKILELHPNAYPVLFQPVLQGTGVKFIEKIEGEDLYNAELRENKDYILLKAYRNNKVFRYCYYVKANSL